MLNPEEREQIALQKAEQERLAKEIAQQKAERLAAQLRAMGINPDDL
jgi:non-ribosomal peptide synthetase component E (peptide arylation enzyme)